MRRRGFLQAAGAVALALPAQPAITAPLPAPAGASPLVVHDALGRAVTIPAPPQRIVPIFASNTEIVASLGLADRIVGIEAYPR